MSNNYDVVIIGSGPGGYVAAARAGYLGLKTAVVEKDRALGGTCLHNGCIPTKALLHAADSYSEIKEASKMGITAEGVSIDWSKVQDYKGRIVAAKEGGLNQLMKSRKVDVYKGLGSLKNKTTVSVKTEKETIELSTKHVVIAVGSKPRALPMAEWGGRIISSDEVLKIEKIPGSLVIIGGGVIGCEFASLFVRMGTEVTLLEAAPRILAPADADVSKELTYQFEQQGVKIHTGVTIKSLSTKKNSAQTAFTTASGESISLNSDYVLIAIGRSPLTEGIGLEGAGITTQRGYVEVNGFMQTQVPHIYAIGDCVNTPWLAHVASYEGLTAIDHLAGKPATPFNYDHTPSCVYSAPPISWCGLSEEEAKKRGLNVKAARFDLSRLGKTSILGQKRGFIKFVTDEKYGEILGVHIIGPEATELIAEPSFAMQMEATIDDIAATMHAHPTVYEGIWEAALNAVGRPLHG